ncbi:MAG: glycerol-3-phosphate 1-O-acyltransferase PlsY [Limisphaerales bacterium]
MLTYLLIAVGAYLLGSIPTGFLVARAKGTDIRKTGSGNIGATNVFRTLGAAAGIFVMLMDALKGYVACMLLCPLVFDCLIAPPAFAQATDEIQIRFKVIAGIGAILGHNFSCWLNFKGGKGVATSAGVFLALTWQAMSIALAAWIIVLALTRYVSMASIAAALVLPTATWFILARDGNLKSPGAIILGSVTIAAALMVIIRHRGNIQRLRAGTEKQISFKRTGAAP